MLEEIKRLQRTGFTYLQMHSSSLKLRHTIILKLNFKVTINFGNLTENKFVIANLKYSFAYTITFSIKLLLFYCDF